MMPVDGDSQAHKIRYSYDTIMIRPASGARSVAVEQKPRTTVDGSGRLACSARQPAGLPSVRVNLEGLRLVVLAVLVVVPCGACGTHGAPDMHAK